MVNFVKIKKLVNEFENKKEYEQKDFFSKLKYVCEIELSHRQDSLLNY